MEMPFTAGACAGQEYAQVSAHNSYYRADRLSLIAKWTTKIYKNDRTALKLRWSLPLSYTILGLQRWFLIVSAQGFTARRWL